MLSPLRMLFRARATTGFHETIVRSLDLLYIQLEFVNWRRDDTALPTPLIRRAGPGPASIIVRLPGQHIAEQVALRDGPRPQLPYRAFLANPSRLVIQVKPEVVTIPLQVDAILRHLTECAPGLARS